MRRTCLKTLFEIVRTTTNRNNALCGLHLAPRPSSCLHNFQTETASSTMSPLAFLLLLLAPLVVVHAVKYNCDSGCSVVGTRVCGDDGTTYGNECIAYCQVSPLECWIEGHRMESCILSHTCFLRTSQSQTWVHARATRRPLPEVKRTSLRQLLSP
jgi:hypothetical protein